MHDLKKKGYASYRKQIVVSSIFYILGFSLVFVLTGAAVASIGVFFRRYDYIIQKVGGIILLYLGLEFAGLLRSNRLSQTKQFQLPSWAGKVGPLRSVLLGIIFAAAWTPCVGPVLGSILALAVTSGHALRGAWLLFVYSIGISVPFMIVSLSLASAPKYLSVITKRIDLIAKIAGILLALLGVLLLTDTYKYLNALVFSLTQSTAISQFITSRV